MRPTGGWCCHPTPASDCAAIGTECKAEDLIPIPIMPGEQGDLLIGRGIVKPNTDIVGDREPTIGGIRDGSKSPISFTEARFRALR